MTRQVEEGATYLTSVAVWTVEHISSDGTARFRRDDGRTARFRVSTFADWIVERIDPPQEATM